MTHILFCLTSCVNVWVRYKNIAQANFNLIYFETASAYKGLVGDE
jgi:hypothetical protein